MHRETGRPDPVSCLNVILRTRPRASTGWARTGWASTGWTRTAIGVAALAAATLLAIQGCAPAPSADAATAQGRGSGVPGYAQTLAQAQDTFTNIVRISTAAAASGDTTAGLSVAADAQWALARAQYTALTAAGTPVPVYRYGPPTYYIPAPDGYPQWFAVTVPRTPVVGGHPGAAVNTIMLFEKGKAKLGWTLAAAAALDQPLPPVAVDSDGYAVAAPLTDGSVLLRPDVVGPTQAAVADEGPANPAATVISAGPQTTGLYAVQAAQAAAEQARGLTYQWLLQGADFAQFELRLRDGGDLVIYGMSLNTTLEHPNLVKGAPLPASAGIRALFAAPTEVGYHAVYANWTYQFAAIDPAATAPHAKLTIIGAAGGLSYGHAY